MNDLQHISEKKHGTVLVTLNPPFVPRPDTIGGRWAYEHPVLNSEVSIHALIVLFKSLTVVLIQSQAVSAQNEMSTIQNIRGISYAGAYLRYGFHEDGFTSGCRVAADHLGARPPFVIEAVDHKPEWGLELVLAALFDILEATGLSDVWGFVLSLQLAVARFWVGLFVDLAHLKE